MIKMDDREWNVLILTNFGDFLKCAALYLFGSVIQTGDYDEPWCLLHQPLSETSASFARIYEKFEFTVMGGDTSLNGLILRNADTTIWLFRGLFEQTMLTFNPGWDKNGQSLESFTDVRELQRQLRGKGIELLSEANESSNGPASFIVLDLDGNPVLVD